MPILIIGYPYNQLPDKRNFIVFRIAYLTNTKTLDKRYGPSSDRAPKVTIMRMVTENS